MYHGYRGKYLGTRQYDRIFLLLSELYYFYPTHDVQVSPLNS